MILKNELTYKHFAYLDGLRAGAILLVILHHLPISLPFFIEFVRIRGDLGVELFFAISGLLVFRSLHQSLLNEKAPFLEFLKKRIFRIFPPYFLTLTIIFSLSLFDHGLLEKLKSIKNILWSFPFFSYNYAKFYSSGKVPGTLNIFWSLCFEEQFYLALFLISTFFKRHLSFFISFGLLFSIGVRVYFFFSNHVLDLALLQMQSHLRMDAILFSCLFYTHWEKIKKYFHYLNVNILFLIILFLIHKYLDARFQGILYAFISFFTTTLIFNLTNTNKHWLLSLLENNFLKKIGYISFEIYLIHEIIVGLAVKIGLKSSPLLFIIFTYVLACFFAKFFHEKFSNPINIFLRKKYIN